MIAICWEQLPIYAARSIGAFVRSCKEKVVVLRVATTRFPIMGAVEMTGTQVIDVAFNDPRSLRDILGEIPEIFVCGGWGETSFVRWMDESHAEGGRVIVCTDEPIRGKDFRETIRKWRFKLLLAKRIDRLFVAGGGGIRKFVDWYGLPKEKVVPGLYAGDPKLFFDGAPITERPKRFVYVGHYDENKNVRRMLEAFARSRNVGGNGWSLELYGGGPLENELKALAANLNTQLSTRNSRIEIHGYVNADQLGPMYRAARCFVLGSQSEQWGVVVHEACMSGCMLLLSNHVGSRFDFVSTENAELFAPDSIKEFARGFDAIMGKSEAEQLAAQRKSVELGCQFSPLIFARNLASMIADLRQQV